MRAFTLLLFLTPTLHALDVSSGPLLVFNRPEVSAGDAAPASGASRRVEALYVVDPQASPRPHRVYVPHGNVSVLARLKTSLLLLNLHNQVCLKLLDLATLQARPLLATDRPTEFIAAEGPVVCFSEIFQERSLGYKLESADDDCRIAEMRHARFKVYGWDAAKNEPPRLLSPRIFQHVVATTPTDLWLIADGNELWRVARNGARETHVRTLPADWEPTLIHAKFSPNGQNVALSAVPRAHFFHKRDLLLLDAETGAVRFEQKRIHVGMDIFSNSIPGLYFSWLDDARLVFEEAIVTGTPAPDTFTGYQQTVEVDAASGRRISEKISSDEILPSYGMPENQPVPPAVLPSASPFRHDGLKLFYKGEPEPLVDLDLERGSSSVTLELSPDGLWALYFSSAPRFTAGHGNAPILLHGPTRTKHRLLAGWIYKARWLPAAPPP